ncbi:GNAT family N-acetyltransferase [Streptantibioticus ferralitis]|uniref:GNAT family N-acetyltransferase n=1 Tax=Streptantibioticus ferralitis TaxID=236510 RepID=A0ABT5YXR7_9ACTN|nr:GNAT family N-acetyltransferase [Streptantibioticus ferralitis]MDF2256391.1 GNAT family N-acetyltransferase [Streptantibioticus ferralitis]
MRPDGWHLTEDLDGFLARAGDFLRSRPALHTMPLTVTESLRTRGADAFGAEAPVFGRLERSGEVRATFYRTPSGLLSLTPLTPKHADTLAARLADLGHVLPGVSAERNTATAFAEAWQQYTGAKPALREQRLRLYRLGTLTPPKPFPDGRGRATVEQDREQLTLWCREFAAAVGEALSVDASSWADTRFASKRYTFWETPDGTPVSMAGVTSMVAGQIRVDPVYTPAHLRGRGYAAAVTVAVSRAALAAGATEVVLFADVANPTSNALYQRIGYLPVTEFAVYDFSYAAPETG